MGSTYIEGFIEEDMDLDRVLVIQLQNNHYPPVSLAFIPACKQAIEACNNEEYNTMIDMPNGRTITAEAIVEGLHLQPFIVYNE